VAGETEANENELGLELFSSPPENDPGLSLDELSEAYARLVTAGEDPYAEATEPDVPRPADPATAPAAEAEEATPEPPDDEPPYDVSPRRILEAMLFVGSPDNQPLTSREVASYMRGVRAEEIDELVVELNRSYEQEGAVCFIESVGDGYRMVLRPEFHSLRDHFYGRIKEARLSQPVIDVLSIVAYKQPLTRDDVDRLRGRPSGAILAQLVRRRLLRMERPEDKPRTPLYHTTERFLELFGLGSLQDLPKSPD
jgi:segregation and condensation protein B